MSFEIKGLNHITFAVENIERSIEFYKTVLNAKLLAKGIGLAYFDVAGIWIALNAEKSIPGIERERTYTHVSFSMSEEDQVKFMEHLEVKDIKYERGRSRNPREGQSVYVRDYDGHLLEFHNKTRKDRLDYYKEERSDIDIMEEIPQLNRLEKQTGIILKLSKELIDKKIEHHFDGSTAKVIQGQGKSMDDIDIVFPFRSITEVRAFLQEKPLSQEIWNEQCGLHHFYYTEKNEKIHLLFYKGLESSFYDYHEQVDLKGEMVWVKGLEFFKSE